MWKWILGILAVLALVALTVWATLKRVSGSPKAPPAPRIPATEPKGTPVKKPGDFDKGLALVTAFLPLLTGGTAGENASKTANMSESDSVISGANSGEAYA